MPFFPEPTITQKKLAQKYKLETIRAVEFQRYFLVAILQIGRKEKQNFPAESLRAAWTFREKDYYLRLWTERISQPNGIGKQRKRGMNEEVDKGSFLLGGKTLAIEKKERKRKREGDKRVFPDMERFFMDKKVENKRIFIFSFSMGRKRRWKQRLIGTVFGIRSRGARNCVQTFFGILFLRFVAQAHVR